MQSFKEIVKRKTVSEFSLNNESHPFYTDYVDMSDDRVVKTMTDRYTRAVKNLKKDLPGGTWSFTIDGTEQ